MARLEYAVALLRSLLVQALDVNLTHIFIFDDITTDKLERLSHGKIIRLA
jgi:hypothetical protein